MAVSLAGKIMDLGFGGELKEAEPLHLHSSLKVGGPAAFFAVAQSVGDIVTLLSCLEESGVSWVLLGAGTNVIFANGGYSGCVIKLGKPFALIRREGENTILAGAAAPLPAVVGESAEAALSGMECLSGIPGTVGGAVFMNAGTREGEIADIIEEVQLLDGKVVRWLSAADLGFTYRSSGISRDHIVLGARFRLKPSTAEEVRSRIKAQADRRVKSQPRGFPSAGCWFRNPEGDSAGRLIDEAGMKGEKCGGAQVSDAHANFLINVGGARASDFLDLAERVRVAVHKRFGVMLQEEVRIVNG